MTTERRYEETHQTWNRAATLYQDKFMDLDLYDPSYDKFWELLPKKDGKVLEIGCGPGNITRHLLKKQRGIKILATDISPEMVKLASRNNPEAETMLLDARNIVGLQENFIGIVAGFCIPYLNVDDVKKLFVDVKQILADNGIVYISTLDGRYQDSGFESGTSGRVFVYYYSDSLMQDLLQEAGLNLLHHARFLFQRNGKDETHLVFIAGR